MTSKKSQILSSSASNAVSQTKVIIFDASTIISLSMNGLLEEFKKLKNIFEGKFIIPKEVKKEVIDHPIKTKRFELEAIKIQALIDEGHLVMPKDLGIDDKEITNLMFRFMDLANTMFISKGQKIKIIHDGEAACLALSKILNEKGLDNVLAIDERTTRMLVEKPENLQKLIEKRTHARIKLKESNFKSFVGFKIIRSTELMYVAYKKGLIRWKSKNVLDALLYALKFKGCAISEEEIDKIKRISNFH